MAKNNKADNRVVPIEIIEISDEVSACEDIPQSEIAGKWPLYFH